MCQPYEQWIKNHSNPQNIYNPITEVQLNFLWVTNLKHGTCAQAFKANKLYIDHQRILTLKDRFK